MSELRIDALLPTEMARRAEYIGVTKAEAPTRKMFFLAVLAGAFIGLGAIFATTVAAGDWSMHPFGLKKLAIGFVFCLGLILVVIGGAELFTGNNLIAMAWASGKITTKALLRNWGVVFVGNFVGSIGTAVLLVMSKQYLAGGSSVGLTALNIANGKVNLDFAQALALGILCNALVCLAVWLTFSARSTVDKIAAIIFPITAFVAAGFEHSIANMYFIVVGLFIKSTASPEFWTTIDKTAGDYANLTWGNFFFANLLPVTIGNIIGGTVFVAAIYWLIFLHHSE